jgi:O-antigen/teichoic acid export membrane protein
MVLDSLLRLGLAVALFVLGGHDAVAFCWTLVVAVALAHTPLLPAAWRRAASSRPIGTPVELDPRPRGTVTATSRSFAVAALPLLVGSVFAQLLLNGMPVLVAASARPEEQAAAGVFVAAFTLARAPLSMVVPLQSAVVPTLTRLLAEGRRDEVRRILLRGTAVLAGLAAAGMPLAALVGPWIVRLVFGQRYVIGGIDLAIVTGGVLAHIALVVLTQVHVARDRHRSVALSWAVALGAAAITFVAVPGLLLAAELAFGLGSLAGATAAVALLLTSRSRRAAHV